ncbi:antitoxin VapB family protein [Haloferacaceae archaeon DSL9]
MGTKTIGLREDVYDRLKARKRDDESFTDLVDRLLDESTPDWRDGFGAISREESEGLERIVADSRARTGRGLASRQMEAIEELAAVDEDADETA